MSDLGCTLMTRQPTNAALRHREYQVGFYSSDCEGCQHPLLSVHAVNGVNDWMVAATVITAGGDLISGYYDGYGRVSNIEVFSSGLQDPTVWHTTCWWAAGEPTDYRGPSRASADQGFFFTTEHDVTVEDAAQATRERLELTARRP